MEITDIFNAILMLVIIGCTIGLIVFVCDEYYIKPTASEKANEYCKLSGFDQYKSFSRVGILSEVPVGIKCEYAEKYTDLGVRT